jgi:hypothetical protein
VDGLDANYSQGQGERAQRGAPYFGPRTTISCMDPEGARALAKRIADGPPAEEDAVPRQEAKPVPQPGAEEEADEPPPRPGPSVEIVYVKPRPVRWPDVRIYVWGADGRLERSDP